MKTHAATKAGAQGWTAGTREWVFQLLPSRRYRERTDLISSLELNRRPDCEPTLRSIVMHKWSPETLHHYGWCESCRTAGLALGVGGPEVVAAGGSWGWGRAGLATLAVAVATIVPLAAAGMIDNPFGGQDPRGGVALTVQAPVAPPAASPSPPPAPPSPPPASPSPSPAPSPPAITPVPRSKPAVRHTRGQQATLPHTT